MNSEVFVYSLFLFGLNIIILKSTVGKQKKNIYKNVYDSHSKFYNGFFSKIIIKMKVLKEN